MHLSCGPPLFNTNGTTPNSFYWTMHSPTFKSEDCNYYKTSIRVMVFCKVANCNNSPAFQVKLRIRWCHQPTTTRTMGNYQPTTPRTTRAILADSYSQSILKCCFNALRNGTQLCGRLRLTNYESIEGALTFVWFILEMCSTWWTGVKHIQASCGARNGPWYSTNWSFVEHLLDMWTAHTRNVQHIPEIYITYWMRQEFIHYLCFTQHTCVQGKS